MSLDSLMMNVARQSNATLVVRFKCLYFQLYINIELLSLEIMIEVYSLEMLVILVYICRPELMRSKFELSKTTLRFIWKY